MSAGVIGSAADTPTAELEPAAADPTLLLSRVVEQLPHPVFVKDRSGRLLLVNAAFAQLVGRSRETLLGTDVAWFFTAANMTAFRELEKKVYATGEPVSLEERLTLADGRTRTLSSTLTGLRGESGEVTHMIGLIQDVTDRRRTEAALEELNLAIETRVDERTHDLRRSQEGMLRNERLVVLGQLSASLRHQISNSMAAIMNATSLLENGLLKGKPLQPESMKFALRTIQEEVWATEEVINELRQFANITEPRAIDLDLHEVFDSALAMAPAPPKVRVAREVPDKLMLRGDGTQVATALSKLLRNAFEAVLEQPAPEVTLSASTDGDWVVLKVADNGSGLNEAQIATAFEPLVSSKVWGLGLGLATAKALVENHGGSVRVSSQVGAGCRFELVFPKPKQ